MGGCRCTFRDCENGTASRKDLHYFRYPKSDADRLYQWAKNANRLEFLDLPVDKLANKVVCQEHFERKMFMNELCDRLTKLAIPRLMPRPGTTTMNVETGTVHTESDSSSSLRELTIEPVQSSSQQTTRKQIVVQERRISSEIPAKRVKILNTQSITQKSTVGTPCEVIRIKTTSTPNGLRKVLNKDVFPLNNSAGPRMMKAKLLNEGNGSLALSVEDTNDVDIYMEDEVQLPDEPGPSPSSSYVNVPQQDVPNSTVGNTVQVVPEPATVYVVDPSLSAKMEQNIGEMEELKKLVQTLANRPEPQAVTQAAAPQKVVMERGPQLTKAQLFNSIKRYLNPAMVTLLRMELFAGPAERQWKPDEKSLAVDMLNLGEPVYDYFKEEFRFRLPSKSDAQQWKDSGEIDVDDAC
uniref:THAP-type domain-containing protein n=1 Tax=Anopheles epiroticus TaxID=199890 RepID=A0A182PLE8_9DIPT